MRVSSGTSAADAETSVNAKQRTNSGGFTSVKVGATCDLQNFPCDLHLICLDGVFGYHVRLTRGRSGVRSSLEIQMIAFLDFCFCFAHTICLFRPPFLLFLLSLCASIRNSLLSSLKQIEGLKLSPKRIHSENKTKLANKKPKGDAPPGNRTLINRLEGGHTNHCTSSATEMESGSRIKIEIEWRLWAPGVLERAEEVGMSIKTKKCERIRANERVR